MRTTLPVLAALLLAAVTSLVGQRAFSIRSSMTPESERYYLPPPIWLKVFSMGYREALADLVWIKGVIYFGSIHNSEYYTEHNLKGDLAKGTGFENYSVNYIDTVTRIDPKFRGAYYKGGTLTLYHKGAITRESVNQAIEIAKRGVEHFPDDGELAFALGFLYYHEAPPYAHSEEEKIRFENEGIRWLRRSAILPGAPPYADTLSATLISKAGINDVVIQHLRTLLLQETNEETRRTLEFQLRRALGEAAEQDIELARKLRERWKEDMPYIDFDLYQILRETPAQESFAFQRANKL